MELIPGLAGIQRRQLGGGSCFDETVDASMPEEECKGFNESGFLKRRKDLGIL